MLLNSCQYNIQDFNHVTAQKSTMFLLLPYFLNYKSHLLTHDYIISHVCYFHTENRNIPSGFRITGADECDEGDAEEEALEVTPRMKNEWIQ